MKFKLLICMVLIITILTCGCFTGVLQKPHSGTFTITKIEGNDGSHWIFPEGMFVDTPSNYLYTLSVTSETGEETVYATQYFINRHQKGVAFSDSTVRLETVNDPEIYIFSSDTPDPTRAKYPEVQSPDGCPVGHQNDNIIWVVYVTNYHDIPNDGAHYFQYFDPDGKEGTYLTADQVIDHINQSVGKYRTDCVYGGERMHDYWENDHGPEISHAAMNTSTAISKIRSQPVNFAAPDTPHPISPAPTRTPLPANAPPGYGCPGCPSNFADFEKDMCERLGSEYTISDGNNTVRCIDVME